MSQPHFKNKAFNACLIAVVALGILIFSLVWTGGTKQRRMAGLQKSVAFRLHYPAKLPMGYSLDFDKLSVKGGVAVYSILNPDKKALVATEQALPKDFDQTSLKGNVEFTTNLGRAYIVTFDDRTTASLITDTSWIVINFNGAMDSEDMKTILRGFQVASR